VRTAAEEEIVKSHVATGYILSFFSGWGGSVEVGKFIKGKNESSLRKGGLRFLFFDTRSHYIALKLEILLPPPPKYWDYTCAPAHPAHFSY
jgi:hypothetical protein